MGTVRKRSKRARDRLASTKESTSDNDLEETVNSPPWKICMMLLFLAVLVVLLLQNSDGNESEAKKPKVIPDPDKPLPPSSAIEYKFKHAAISSDSQACSEIARDILKIGGNSFDATIALLICSSLMQIQSMGMLGGFLLTAYIKSERKLIVVDAQMTSPKNFQMPIQNFNAIKEGPLSVAVPGFLSGLWSIHRKYGTIEWRKLIEPTLELCYDGILITKHLYDSMNMNKRIIKDHYLRKLFVDEEMKKFKRPGTKMHATKSCQFLEILSNHTSPEIYSHDVGNMIADDLKLAGTAVTIDDLLSYKVKWNDAITKNINENLSIHSPNTGAALIPAILNILNEFKINDYSDNINETILNNHRIVETFKHIFAFRSQLGDPDFVPISEIVQNILSPEYAKRIHRLIDDEKTFNDPKYYSAKFIAPDDDGTSHASIIAPNGDAISVTSSINYYFGAGFSGSKTGLIFNNGMDDFSFPGRAVNYFGLTETPTNYPEPMKRALSSMSPLIVTDSSSGNVQLVIGAAGGSKIISTLALALLRYSCCTKSLKEILDSPRFHHQLVPNAIEYEYGLINDIIEGLIAKGHKLKRFKNRGTVVNALSVDQHEINALSDYRKDTSGVAGY